MYSKWDLLKNELIKEFSNKEPGHCIRVDNLLEDDALNICKNFLKSAPDSVEAFVLSDLSHNAGNNIYIRVDEAIEKRNRKEKSICLFVPIHLVDAALSSLKNSFSFFSLVEFFKRMVRHQRTKVEKQSKELGEYIKVLRKLFRKLKTSPEEELDYYQSLLASPDLHTAGKYLWQIGLIPDYSEQKDYSIRLEMNCDSVLKLTQPERAQGSISERVKSLNLMPDTIQMSLIDFLKERRIQGNKLWIKDLVTEPYAGDLTFEKWIFPQIEKSDLEKLELNSFLDEKGNVLPKIGLTQPDGAHAELHAECGPKKKLKVSWNHIPKNPSNVESWQIKLLPSIDEYGENYDFDTSVLPIKKVKMNVSRVDISLDIADIDELPYKKIQVELTPLDKNNQFILKDNSEPWKALSYDFWLISSTELPEEEDLKKKGTIRSIPDAYLNVAYKMSLDEISIKFGPWEERDLHYLPIIFNDKFSYRLGISLPLKQLEEENLTHPDFGGYFKARSTGVNTITPNDWKLEKLNFSSLNSRLVEQFLKARKDLFNYIGKTEPGRLLAFINIDDEVDNLIIRYCKNYQKLLEGAIEEWGADPSETLLKDIKKILNIDCLELDLHRCGNNWTSVLIMLPEHPLRALWYLSYTQLINYWVKQLVNKKKNKKEKYFDNEIINYLSPINLPAFLPCGDKEVYTFLDNLQFHYGIFIPPRTGDPGNLYGEIARVLGVEDDETYIADFSPEEVSYQVINYLDTHCYLNYLRIAVLNPGDGSFIGKVLRYILKSLEESKVKKLEHFDIISYSPENLQSPLPGIKTFSSDLYNNWGTKKTDHLKPLASNYKQFASREYIKEIPGGDVQIAFCMDYFKPEITLKEIKSSGDSSAVYGLLTKFLSNFSVNENGVEWSYVINFAEKPEVEKHPVRPLYTDLLIETHRIWLKAISLLIDKKQNDNRFPSLITSLKGNSFEIINHLHKQSDWVITLDRYLGVELFDSPQSVFPDYNYEKYILDYTPQFFEGVSHKKIVTTSWQDEILSIIEDMLPRVGLSRAKDLSLKILNSLKSLSGNFAMSLLSSTEERQKQMIGVALIIKYLRRRSYFKDSIIIPLGYNRQFLKPPGKMHPVEGFEEISDFMLVTPTQRTIQFAFIKVELQSKWDQASSQGIIDRIVEQNTRTEKLFQSLFFNPDRIDYSLFQSWLNSILLFYLERSKRYGLLNEEQYKNLNSFINRVVKVTLEYKSEHHGIILITDENIEQIKVYNDCKFHILSTSTAADVLFQEKEEDDYEELPKENEDNSDEIHKKSIPNENNDKIVSEITQVIEDADTVKFELGITKNNNPIIWEGSVKGTPHLLVVGIPGQGKSVTLTRFMIDIVKQGIPFITFDFHGQYSGEDELFARETKPRIIHAHYGLPFTPFEATKSRDDISFWQNNAYEVAEIIGYVCKMGDMQKDTVYQAIKESYEALGFSNEAHEGNSNYPKIKDVYEKISILQQQGGQKNVLARCRPIFEFGLFKENPGEWFSIGELLKEPLVIDVSRLTLESVQTAAGAFFLRKLWKDMFQWGEQEKPRLLLVLDEAHRLSKDATLPKIMREGRKFGIIVLLASQQIEDFHRDIVRNCGSIIAFKSNYPESKSIAQYLRGPDNLKIKRNNIESLKVGKALVQLEKEPGSYLVNMHNFKKD